MVDGVQGSTVYCTKEKARKLRKAMTIRITLHIMAGSRQVVGR